jgi:hypothetical protein
LFFQASPAVQAKNAAQLFGPDNSGVLLHAVITIYVRLRTVCIIMVELAIVLRKMSNSDSLLIDLEIVRITVYRRRGTLADVPCSVLCGF